MKRFILVCTATAALVVTYPALTYAQLILDEGIDSTLAEAGLNGPDLEHGGFDENGRENLFFNHPEGDNTRWEFDGSDSTNFDGGDAQNHGILWFDIPSETLSAFGENDFAFLKMHTADNGDAAEMYRITSDWLSGPEGGNLVTWNNMADGPGIVPGQNAEATASQQWPLGQGGTEAQVDVSADLRAWGQGAPNYGWGFVPLGGDGHAITSFESENEPIPTLILGARLKEVITPVTLDNTDQGHTWKYFDLFTEGDNPYPRDGQGDNWNESDYDDSFWSSGKAIFGHGRLSTARGIEHIDSNNPDAKPFGTVIASSESSANPRKTRETDLFRTTFNVSDLTNVTGIGFDLIADDGAVIYINGEEVVRTGNIASGRVNTGTRATPANNGTSESTHEALITFFGNNNPLVIGENTIAVELHQDRPTSNDRGFDLGVTLLGPPGTAVAGPELQAGDADEDLDFDQLDLVKVQIAAKYLTGQAATWGQGDWNGAPGGSPGSPPAGDGFFNQFDVIAAQIAAVYLTGPYAAINKGGTAGDGQTSIVYNTTTGELAVDAPAGTDLTSVNIESAGSIFTGDAASNLGGSFDNDSDNNIFKATFGSSFGSLSFGNVAQTGLSEDFVANDLTVVGSLAGGGDLGAVDLIYVPEPSTLVMLCLGLLGLTAVARRGRTRG